jgi:site-specific DNA-methyltransferase (adenine-specific)
VGAVSARVEHGDCLAVIPRLASEGVRVDAIVTDPPYGLEFMGKEWDRFRGSNSGIQKSGYEKLGQHGTPTFDANRRNQKCPRCGRWAYDYPDRKCVCGGAGAEGRRIYCAGFQQFCEAWASAAFEILRPGGFLVAFGGTRTYHRLVCAIEDAGFVIQDQIAWLYGSGFPKHRSHLKPAHEPICLAYKPGGPRTLGVDECRVGTDGERLGGGNERAETAGKFRNEGWLRPWMDDPVASVAVAAKVRAKVERASSLGRWPANVMHDGSAEVLAAFGAFGDKPTGGNVFKRASGADRNGNRGACYGAENRPAGMEMPWYGDSGSAARFFYAAKADAQDRWGSRHPTVKPIDLIRWLVSLVVPPGGIFLDPFAGSGTAAVAALASGRNAILIERDATYVADIRERIAHYDGDGNHSVVSRNRARPLAAAGSLL